MRLIDADVLYTELVKMNDFGELSAKKAIRIVSKAQTVDAVPVRHGKWIGKNIGDEHYDYCSECRYIEWNAPNNYCPNCGAKMDEDEE